MNILASQYSNVINISEIVTDPATQSAAMFNKRVVTEKSNCCKCPAEFSQQTTYEGRGRPQETCKLQKTMAAKMRKVETRSTEEDCNR